MREPGGAGNSILCGNLTVWSGGNVPQGNELAETGLEAVYMHVVIVLSAAVGLLLHSGAVQGEFRGAGMFCYYTNLSNLVIGLYSLLFLLVPGLRAPLLWFSMSMGIFLTFLIYHFVLLPAQNRHAPGSWKKPDNLLVHYVTPLLSVVNWLLYAPKDSLNGVNCLAWLLLPAAYLVFALIRAGFGPIEGGEKRYPYHFMDPDRIGWRKVVRNLLALTILCVAGTEGIAAVICFLQ